jgi:hypothetical protein
MWRMLSLLVCSVMAVSVQDYLNGAEIGDETQFVVFRTGGSYYAERKERSGRTKAKGKWTVRGDRIEVKVASCQGPSCATLAKPWSASVEVRAERVMTLKSEEAHAALPSGSYYCARQGCEQRIGVELVSHEQRTDVMKRLLEFLIDKNRSRDVTVVWIGQERSAPRQATQVILCGRENERAKTGAALVTGDLRELGWVGQPRLSQGPAECLYDVRVIVGDDVRVPPGR